MELKETKIYKYPMVLGSYGSRYAVPDKKTRLIEIFNALKVWIQDKKIINGESYTVFELPMRYDVESNPLIMYWLDGQNTKIVEMTENVGRQIKKS